MKVWAITFKEFGGAEEIVVERRGDEFVHLLFADTTEGYNLALVAFRRLVADRIGKGQATYEYGQFGVDGRTPIIARSEDEHEDCCGYSGDTIELRPYDVIGG